jgi:hypothetical protein
MNPWGRDGWDAGSCSLAGSAKRAAIMLDERTGALDEDWLDA